MSNQPPPPAVRSIIDIYDRTVPSSAFLPCIACGSKGQTHLHHLDERHAVPVDHRPENLVPLCSNHNLSLKHSYESFAHVDGSVTPSGLWGRALAFYAQGELLPSYACARLAAFVAARPSQVKHGRRTGAPIDADEAVHMAARSLLPLRGLQPSIAIPLARDTLWRSILLVTGPGWSTLGVTKRTRFVLAEACGMFHREYGDLKVALEFFRVARLLSRCIGAEHRATPQYRTFRRNCLMLRIARDRRGVNLLAATEKLQGTPHRDFNTVHWVWRQQLRRATADDAATIGHAVLRSIREHERKLLRGGRPVEEDYPRMKWNGVLSHWLRAEVIAVKAAASLAAGRTAQARDLAQSAVRIFGRHALATAPQGLTRQFEDAVALLDVDDRIEFRTPSWLYEPRGDLSGDVVGTVSELTAEVLRRLWRI